VMACVPATKDPRQQLSEEVAAAVDKGCSDTSSPLRRAKLLMKATLVADGGNLAGGPSCWGIET
jgi:hypothetical protein